MALWSERTVSEIRRLPGADHSYLKHLCADDGESVRDGLRQMVARIGEPFTARAEDLLSSLDNRKFFQGFAETVSLSLLVRQGWSLRAIQPVGARLTLVRPDGVAFALAVSSFLHQTRPGGEAQTIRRMIEALARVTARHRFVVLIRRWPPHDFDPEPVRRALESWLAQVGTGQWEGRYAAYEDERIALEFCLTGEKTRGRQAPLAFALGPFVAHRAMEVLEPRVVRELDRHLASPESALPLLVAAVSDQPWSINPGYLRDFLYGRATLTQSGDDGSTWEFGGLPGPCAFRDPLYDGVSGLLLVDREPTRPLEVRAQALLNPWARVGVAPAEVGIRAFGAVPGAAPPTMRWYVGDGEALPLG